MFDEVVFELDAIDGRVAVLMVVSSCNGGEPVCSCGTELLLTVVCWNKIGGELVTDTFEDELLPELPVLFTRVIAEKFLTTGISVVTLTIGGRVPMVTFVDNELFAETVVLPVAMTFT